VLTTELLLWIREIWNEIIQKYSGEKCRVICYKFAWYVGCDLSSFPYYLVEYNIDIKQRFGSLLICDIKANEKYGIKSELKYHIFSNQYYEGQDNLLKYVSGEIVLCTVQGRNYYVTKAETLKRMNK